MTTPSPQGGLRGHSRRQRRWKLGWSTIVVALIALVGVGLSLYPSTAAWWSQYNQSRHIVDLIEAESVSPEQTHEELDLARKYNDGVSGGGAVLAANSNIPTSDGENAENPLEYNNLLRANDVGLMGRLQVPIADIDLPIYHGTSDATLEIGVGHLEGTSLPVGGESTHSVLTAHRGLASSTLFSNLDVVKEGDLFAIEVFGEVLTYQVVETQVVSPDDTQTLLPQYGRDLVTLVTCTPLGINSHRILVTGERITPTPDAIRDAATQPPVLPRFPWWAVGIAAGVLLVVLYVWWAGYPPRPRRKTRAGD